MEEDKQKWHHLFPDDPPSTGTALPGKAVRWPQGPFHARLRSHPVRGQPAGSGGVYLPSCLPTRTLQSQPWASSVFLAVSKCVVRTKRSHNSCCLLISHIFSFHSHLSETQLSYSPSPMQGPWRAPLTLSSRAQGQVRVQPPKMSQPSGMPPRSRDDRGQPVVTPAPHSLLVTQFSA